MTDDEAREVAGRLTVAARRAMMIATKRPEQLYGADAYEVSPGSCRKALEREGLIFPREWRGLTGSSRRGYAATPNGLLARILQENRDGE